jgi:type 1 glutamine amidotransferase
VVDLDEAERALRGQNWDVITVYACWFRMLDSRYSDFQRQRWARTCSLQLREALAMHRRRGTPLLAIHTAPICFDDWSEWSTWLGGAWQWGSSFHPEPDIMTIRPLSTHPIVAGIESFQIRDERYSRLHVDPSSEILLASVDSNPPGSSEPTLWINSTGPGRVVYDALGHDSASLENSCHQTLIRRGLAWLFGHDEDEVRNA